MGARAVVTTAEPTTGTTVAAFDFDGTLIRGDSLRRFLHSALGRPSLIGGSIGGLAAAALAGPTSLLDRGKAKEHVVASCFGGWTEHRLRRAGERFAAELLGSDAVRPELMAALHDHLDRRHRVIIVSASLDCYLGPVADSLGVELACTRLRYHADGRFAGSFDGPNCRGDEKVRQLEALGVRGDDLTAYGDSAGDEPMLRFAAVAHRVGRSGSRR